METVVLLALAGVLLLCTSVLLQALYLWLAAKLVQTPTPYLHCMITTWILCGIGALVLGTVIGLRFLLMSESVVLIVSVVLGMAATALAVFIMMKRFDIGIWRCLALILIFYVIGTIIGLLINYLITTAIIACGVQDQVIELQTALQDLLTPAAF